MASHYNVTAAKQAFLDHMADVAASQDLHQNQAPRVRRTAIAVTSLAGMFVVLRLLARLRQRVSFHTDDWLIIMSFWGLVANLAITLVLLHQGLGRHSGALTLAETQILLKTLIGAELLYVYVLGLLKMSILFFYNRIFPVRDMKIGSRICGGVTLAWTLACTLAVLLQCRPMTKMWEPWLQGTCINTFVMQLVVSFLNILIDSSILLLPMPQIWKLHMKTSQKISLIAIFSVGSFAVFTSIFRFRVYWLYDGDDMSYTLAEACSWNIIEISSGVMSACLPSLVCCVLRQHKSSSC
ncbi:hypothetical protein BGZ61DRAFT_365547 [Ilyonectria robusta]|uniref:uncharacterized protein n=1 Tax=Ilyonectria robusta TaxID=1079257 RepID=UPI001E8E387C|nr:uncharacterized protein BGZ61DRAFT_365547 [Ilyonectria robusta]KAH8666212.1 hypothetical protein BGZ61DRAFT_365547 [Ilyonectria robusta]